MGLLGALVGVGACGEYGRDSGQPIPVDQATSSDRLRIQETLGEIEELIASFGVPVDFKSIPIVVTDDMEAAGVCQRDPSGSRTYIGIHSLIMNIGNPSFGTTSPLFDVLLHEIGHCYFGRNHDDTQIERDGADIIIVETGPGWRREIPYASVPASIMISEVSVALPVSLKRYYVGELLGKYRATDATELRDFASLYFLSRPRVPRSAGPRTIRRMFVDDHIDHR